MLLLAAGLALCAIATGALALALRRERDARRAADAALAARQDETARQAAQLALFDRRRAALAPIEALWVAWARDCRPEEALLAEAARALGEARLLFDEMHSAELEEAAGLLVEHVRGQSWQRAAVDAGRYEERAELIAEEIDRERRLKPCIAQLRQRLADAARIG